MGKGLAALTFDKDYQKKRREQINKKPATLHEGIARSGKGLVMVSSLLVILCLDNLFIKIIIIIRVLLMVLLEFLQNQLVGPKRMVSVVFLKVWERVLLVW